MPRAGRFGRLPRRAPDLSGAIAAMLREYWNTTEQNMVDAWRNGGEVDGSQVTDDDMIAFWKERRDSVQRDDPLWEHYDNLIGQYDFAIRESEVELKYAQHKMTAREVARWYKGESDNYVRDSEIYRTIMGQAAAFMDAARAGAAASNAERRTRNYERKTQNIMDQKIAPFMLVTGLLDSLSRSVTNQGTPLSAGDEGDPGQRVVELQYQSGGPDVFRMTVELAQEIANDPAHPMRWWWDQEVLPRAEAIGMTITADDFTEDAIRSHSANAVTGYSDWNAVAHDFKDIVDEDEVKAQNDIWTQNVRNGAAFYTTFDEEEQYLALRSDLQAVIDDPTSTPEQIVNAFATHFSNLTRWEQGLVNGGGDPTDYFNLQVGAWVERRAILGDPAGIGRTVAEGARNTPFGTEGERDPYGTTGLDVVTLGQTYRANLLMTQQVRAGTHVYIANDDGSLSAVPITQLGTVFPGGYAILPKPLEGVRLVTPREDDDSTVSAVQGLGHIEYEPGVTGRVVVPTIPIIASAPDPNAARDPVTGRVLSNTEQTLAGDPNLGVVVPTGTDPETGQPTYSYGMWATWTDPVTGAAKSGMRYTSVPPFFDSKLGGTPQVVQGANGLEFRVTGNSADETTQRPSAADAAVMEFDPHTLVNNALLVPTSSWSFNNVALSTMTATPADRARMAKMSAEEIYFAVIESPEIASNLTPETTDQVWTDVNLVRRVAALDEWGARQTINLARNRSNIWNMTGAPTYQDIEADTGLFGGMNNILGALGLGELGQQSALAGLTPEMAALASPETQNILGIWSARDRAYAAYAATASQYLAGRSGSATGPYVPTAPMGPPPPAIFNPNPPGLMDQVPGLDQYGYPTGSAPSSYGQPTIQVAGQISVPGMPNVSPMGAPVTPPHTTTPPPFNPRPPTSPSAPSTPSTPTPPYPGAGNEQRPWGFGPCFIAGTMISTPGGAVAIEDLTFKDRVLAFNPQTQEFVESFITRIWVHANDQRPRFAVTLDDGVTVTATDNHPFYAPDVLDFLPLSEFRRGDSVFTTEGIKYISEIEPEPDEPVDVYNITVERFNTYVANGIAVHNKET